MLKLYYINYSNYFKYKTKDAYKKINTIKVEIDGVVTEYEYPYDAPVDPIEDPTKEGYTFDKWVDENGNEVTPPSTMPEEDITIKAEWKVNTYNVTFNVVLLVSGQEIDTYEHTVTATFAPQPGNSYDIKAVINATNIDPEHAQEPIEFTVNELPDWGTATGVNAQYPQNN